MDTIDHYILGETDKLINFETRSENRGLAAAMATQAKRSIDILTPDLEAPVYDSRPMIYAITRLSTRSRFTTIRVLIKDSAYMIKHGHRLVEVARRFSSSILLHKPAHEYLDFIESFLLVDERAYIHKKISSRYEGDANFNDPLRARELSKYFNELWETSEPDIELRHLHI